MSAPCAVPGCELDEDEHHGFVAVLGCKCDPDDWRGTPARAVPAICAEYKPMFADQPTICETCNHEEPCHAPKAEPTPG